MRDIIDVAAYIIEKVGDVSTMKLQKLAYYSQAYCLVDKHEALFGNRIEAWANGPVIPDLFKAHRRKYVVNIESMDFRRKPCDLDPNEKAVIDHVVNAIGSLSGSELSQLSHSEKPWLDARKDLNPGERSNRQITDEAIQSYYSSIDCHNKVFRAA